MERRYMMRRYIPALALVALLVLGITHSAKPDDATPPLSAEGTQDGVRFRVSLEKSVFVEGEPVIATLTLTNTSKKDLVLGEPAYWTAATSVARKSGAEMPGGIELSMVPMPADFGQLFRPGESRSFYRDVSWPWRGDLPVDQYIVKSRYHSDPESVGNKRINWKGQIVLPEISFEIVPARDPKETAASGLYRNTPYLTGGKPDLYKGAAIMHGISDPDYGGVFAPSAGYRETEALRAIGDRTAYIAALQQYAKKHDDQPYYYHRALTSLGDALCQDGKWSEARAVYEKLPDGYYSQQMLRQCDEHLKE